MSSRDCTLRSRVDDHFAGRIRPRAEQALRRHLPECAACSLHYERRLLLSKLDPRGIDAGTRLGIGLGLRARRIPLAAALSAASAVAALTAIVFFLLWPTAGPSPAEFAARGPGAMPARLLVYNLQPGTPPALAEEEIGADDELAFAYENTGGKKRLLVFGVDEHRNIYWYHPGWLDAARNPVAVSIEPGPGIHELPEAVSHRLNGKNLLIHGIFTDEPLSVRDMETLVHGQVGQTDPLPVPGAFQVLLPLRVRH